MTRRGRFVGNLVEVAARQGRSPAEEPAAPAESAKAEEQAAPVGGRGGWVVGRTQVRWRERSPRTQQGWRDAAFGQLLLAKGFPFGDDRFLPSRLLPSNRCAADLNACRA